MNLGRVQMLRVRRMRMKIFHVSFAVTVLPLIYAPLEFLVCFEVSRWWPSPVFEPVFDARKYYLGTQTMSNGRCKNTRTDHLICGERIRKAMTRIHIIFFLTSWVCRCDRLKSRSQNVQIVSKWFCWIIYVAFWTRCLPSSNSYIWKQAILNWSWS